MKKKAKLKPVMGAPTKYKPEYDQMLIAHMGRGLGYKSFAGVVKINPDTLYEWENAQPSWKEAKGIAQGASELFYDEMQLRNFEIDPESSSFNTTLFLKVRKNMHDWVDRLPGEVSKIVQSNEQTNVNKSEESELMRKFRDEGISEGERRKSERNKKP